MRTINKIIDKVNCQRGAPMGRSNEYPNYPYIIEQGEHNSTLINHHTGKRKRIFDCAVPMSDGCYDKGGAYWGMGAQLRVSYTKDLSYINFYRVKH